MFLNCFLNELNFTKIILKSNFTEWHVLRENCYVFMGVRTICQMFLIYDTNTIRRHELSVLYYIKIWVPKYLFALFIFVNLLNF